MKPPKRWLSYRKSGKINGTRLVAFKVPLKKEYFTQLPLLERFTPQHVIRKYPKIKLVIDLTFTTKYYNGQREFQNNGVQYKKIKCRGRIIPTEEIFKRFVEVVDTFLRTAAEDYLIGVHCTHGVNRTGYLIVRYMIERMNYSPERALREFVKSRGHGIERTPYIADLLKRGGASRSG